MVAIQQYYKVQYNLRVQHIDDIALLYKYSWVSLGSTTPSYDWDRNGKGFRDWLSPGCGTVLIHDDWEPYKEIFDGVVPMYEYGDSSSLVVIMENLKKDQKMYNHYWQQQNRWIEQNTIEQQIYRAIKDEKVLCCL